MRTLAGPEAQIHFTALSNSSANSLSNVFKDSITSAPAKATATAHQIGILELMKRENVPLEKVCLLDPKAEKELSPEDGQGTFYWFLFGGILGDDPPRDRTGELRKLGFPTRHLGNIQMTTDTALGVTKKVVHDGVKIQDIPYTDFPTIKFNARESVEMPFRYIAVNGNPVLPPGMRELLHKDLDRGFDF